jgi:26S proteasome regulatory subunit N2
MLSEPSPQLVSAALSRLLAVVDTLWHEVSESLPELEALAEDAELESLTRQTAAAVASRVFFHLEEPAQALRLALEAGERHFDIVNDKSAYVETLIAAAVEAYIEQKGQATAAGDGGADADSPSALDMDKLERVVDLMFQRCYVDGTFEHALGVAFEAREAVKASEVLKRAAQEGPEVRRRTLDYALDAAVTLVASKAFRVETLMIVADELSQEFHETRGTEGRKTAAVALCQAHQILGQAAPVSQLITSLLEATEEEALLGLQLCFDLIDSGDQGFINAVAEGLALPKPTPADQAVTVTVDGDGDGLEVVPSVLPERSESIVQRFQNVQRILTDGFSSELALSFLHKNSDSDKLIMENLKKALEDRASGSGRNSILHNCAVATHAYLNAGTTNDSFLRDHLDWMRKASNW